MHFIRADIEVLPPARVNSRNVSFRLVISRMLNDAETRTTEISEQRYVVRCYRRPRPQCRAFHVVGPGNTTISHVFLSNETAKSLLWNAHAHTRGAEAGERVTTGARLSA